MAAAIKDKFGVEAEMIEGGGGVFDVHINGTQIWHKKETGRFPEHHEVLDRITGLSTTESARDRPSHDSKGA